MITRATAAEILIAYDEIEKAEKLLDRIGKLKRDGEEVSFDDVFGRRRNSFQLGVPSGENGHQLFDVQPELAISVIKAHIANKKAVLDLANQRAAREAQTP